MNDRPQNLLKHQVERYVLEVTGSDSMKDIMEDELGRQVRIERQQEMTRLYSDDNEKLRELASKLKGAQYFLRQANLEDVFLRATGRRLNDKQ
jgi:lipooligosaccharide transport system ATP-binding protein